MEKFKYFYYEVLEVCPGGMGDPNLRHCHTQDLTIDHPFAKSVIESLAVCRELKLRKLAILPWTESDMEVAQLMIWHQDKWLSPIMKMFMDTTRELLTNSQ